MKLWRGSKSQVHPGKLEGDCRLSCTVDVQNLDQVIWLVSVTFVVTSGKPKIFQQGGVDVNNGYGMCDRSLNSWTCRWTGDEWFLSVDLRVLTGWVYEIVVTVTCDGTSGSIG